MCVSSDARRKGIGSQLLKHIQPDLKNIECYCFPFTHLQRFYADAGFLPFAPESAPEAITDKFNRYINNGKKICLMKHHQALMLE